MTFEGTEKNPTAFDSAKCIATSFQFTTTNTNT